MALNPLTTTFSVLGNGFQTLKQIQKSYEDLKKSFKTTETEAKSSFGKMNQYANSFFDTMKKGAAKVGTGFRTQLTREALGIKNAFSGVGGKMLGAAAIIGVTASLSGAIQEYQRFDDVMLQTKAISKANESQYISLREQAKELGRTTRFTAEQVAQAQKFQAIAGWKVNAILEATPAIMNLAAASGEDLAMVSDIVTDSMTAFGWEAQDASKFTDILAATATSANTNISMLGESFKYVSPTASVLGETVEDTATYLGLLANAGIKGSMAGTSLNQVFSSLLTPGDEASKMIEKLGLKIYDAHGNFVGLKKILPDLRKGLEGLGSGEKAAILNKIFGERGGRAINTLLKATNEEIETLNKTIKNSQGATQKMADIMNSGLGGAMDSVKSAMSGLMIEIVEVFSETGVNALKGFADWINEITKRIKPMAESFKKFYEENKVGVAFIAGAIGLIVAPITTIIAAVVIMYKKFEWFRNLVNGVFNVAIFLIKTTTKVIQGLWNGLETTYNWLANIFSGVKDAFVSTFNYFKELFSKIFELLNLIPGMSLVFQAFGLQIEAIKFIFSNLFKFIKYFIVGAIMIFADFAKFTFGVFSSVTKFLLSAFKMLGKGIMMALDWGIEKLKKVYNWVSNLGAKIKKIFNFGGDEENLKKNVELNLKNNMSSDQFNQLKDSFNTKEPVTAIKGTGSTSEIKTIKNTSNNVNININGGDTQEIKRVIEETLFEKEVMNGNV